MSVSCRMRQVRVRVAGRVLAGLLAAAEASVHADEDCPGFNWDISAEHALFMSAPLAVTAGKEAGGAPALAPGRLMQLQLAPVAAVTFAAPPAHKAWSAESYAGLAKLSVPRTGTYRISVNQNVWIDVVTQGRLIPAVDYEGSRSCDAPHKIVTFRLTAGKPLVLQLSSATQAAVRVALTPAPQL